MAIEEMSRLPATGPLYCRAVAGSLTRTRRPGAPPRAELLVTGVAVTATHLDQYLQICGFPVTDTLPATYPHVLGFPLSLDLMTRPQFPFPLPGLVHIENTIEQRRPVRRDERLDFAVRAERLREHRRGHAVDVVTTATVDGAAVWHERSTYLRKSAGPGRGERSGRTADLPHPPGLAAVWPVDRGVGRAYARVSGDRNPIHTSTLAAKAFGFPHRIAPGMWLAARCLAAFGGRLPDEYTVDVAFKLPVLLPATVAFFSARAPSGGWHFAVRDRESDKPHLAGSITG